MSHEWLNTGEVLAAGILNKPLPETTIPKDREETSVDIDDIADEAALSEALERGVVLYCSEYYGIPHVWKQDEGVYRAGRSSSTAPSPRIRRFRLPRKRWSGSARRPMRWRDEREEAAA